MKLWNATKEDTFHLETNALTLQRAFLLMPAAEENQAEFVQNVTIASLNAAAYAHVLEKISATTDTLKFLVAIAHIQLQQYSQALVYLHELTEKSDVWILDLLNRTDLLLLTGLVYELWAQENVHFKSVAQDVFATAACDDIAVDTWISTCATWKTIAVKCDDRGLYALSAVLWSRIVDCRNGMSVGNYTALATAYRRSNQLDLAHKTLLTAHQLAPWLLQWKT